MPVDTRGRKKNLYEQAYSSIRSLILNGKLAPGEKLRETKLAEELNISRTPIRDALRKLEMDGLVVFYPSQGAEVASLSKKTLLHLFECNSVLEGLAVRKAVENIDDETLVLLEETLFLAKKYFEDGDLEKVVDKNTLFHDTIMKASQNPSLIQMMEQIRTQILAYRSFISFVGFRPNFWEDHWNIFYAISDRDSTRAEELMRQHILDDHKVILSELETYFKRNKVAKGAEKATDG